MAALTLGLLRGGAGERWDSSQVRLKVSDVSALPTHYQGGAPKIAAPSLLGEIVSFAAPSLTSRDVTLRSDY